MPLPLSTNPEDVYSDVAIRAQAFADLSVKLAASGDGYGASLALIASDACNMQALLWQSALVVSPDQDGQYAAVLRTMDAALTGWAAHGGRDDIDCAAVLRGARDAIRDAFDDSVWQMLEPRLAPLNHLAALPVPSPEQLAERSEKLLTGTTALQAAAARGAAARDSAAVAAAMTEHQRVTDAVTAAYYADMATFEGHVIASAAAFDDVDAASAEALVLLAGGAVARISALPADVTRALTSVRFTLRSVVGLLDARNLDSAFLPPEEFKPVTPSRPLGPVEQDIVEQPALPEGSPA